MIESIWVQNLGQPIDQSYPDTQKLEKNSSDYKKREVLWSLTEFV